MDVDDSSIIFAYIPIKKFLENVDSEDDPDDDDWVPKSEKKKVSDSEPKPIVLNIKNPRPVKNLDDLIEVLESSIKYKPKKKQTEKPEEFFKEKDITDQKTKKLKLDEKNEKIAMTRSKSKEMKKQSPKGSTSLEELEKKKERIGYKNQVRELVSALKELRDMIGMESIKQNIVNQLLLFLQGLNDSGMFLHTVLTGNPGVGKTSLCHILAKIYKSMGFLKKSEVVVADRPSLIGQWLGETSIKTKKVLDSARGCVLLIDEAYSLGSEEGRDSFSKECIDTINQYLSEHVDELVCIVAGYKDMLNKCFFNHNPGLSRRFPWRYHINDYTIENMYDIMMVQIGDSGWSFKPGKEYILSVMNKNKKLFKNNGGDTKNFFEKCKICHAQRIFGTSEQKKLVTEEDIKEAIKLFNETQNEHKKDTYNEPALNMYI